MIRKFVYVVVVALGALSVATQLRAALVVTQPTGSTVISAGDDYATQVLGNAWDMNDSIDIASQESAAVTSQLFSAGVFSGDTTANGANIYPVFMGYASSINLSRGALHPIDTSHYRYVTYKLRVNQSTQPQFTRVIGVLDGGSYGASPKVTVVEGRYTAPLPNSAWKIVNFDMVSSNDNLFYQWTDFSQLTGLRIDPASTNVSPYASAHFDIDWIRLTAPATAAQKCTVQWADPGFSGPYSIAAIDADGTSYTLGTNVSGSSYSADMTFLPPGQYAITVARGSVSAASSVFRINNPPKIAMTAPSVRGEQALDFATTIVGNPWGPIDATDFSISPASTNFMNVSYNTPSGAFYGRPLNSDPNLFFNLGGHAIDASVYRSLCFTMEVFGPRKVGQGSVARLFWGNSTSALTTTDDIVLDDNLSGTQVGEYCIPDLASALLESNQNGGTWLGSKTVFRLDPDELAPPPGCGTRDTCHDVQLNAVVLSPFAQANPSYTFNWNLSDVDNGSVTLSLALDPDTIARNGNEIPVYGSTASIGHGQFAWTAPASIPYGTYHVRVSADDGLNMVDQYAGGVIIVGPRDGIFRSGLELLPSPLQLPAVSFE